MLRLSLIVALVTFANFAHASEQQQSLQKTSYQAAAERERELAIERRARIEARMNRFKRLDGIANPNTGK